MFDTKIGCMSSWSEELVTRIAKKVRERRSELHLSAQEVADRSKALGHPISRSAISDLENSRRKDRLLIGDAVILAEALSIPLSTLMFPQLPDGPVELSPGHAIPSVEAMLWVSGLSEVVNMPVDLGDDRDVMEERIEGSNLGALSYELRELRMDLDNYRDRYRSALHGERGPDGNPEDLDLLQKVIETMEGRAKDLTRMIRATGGVVNDG